MKRVYFYFLYYFIVIVGVLSCSKESLELEASFSVQPEKVEVGTVVSFTDLSIGADDNTSYLWNFGDGKTSNDQNPTHVYSKIGGGMYEISLTIRNGNSEDTYKKEILVSLPDDIGGRKSLLAKLRDDKMLVCAHRAYHKNYPENSISAIQDAIYKGVDMVEIDVRKTSDGEIVLMHDATIDRTTNGSGKVSDYTLSEIQQFKLYNSNYKLTNEKIPTLKEVLSLFRGQVYIDLDISNKVPFDKVYPLVKQFGMIKQTLFYISDNGGIENIEDTDSNAIAMPIIRNKTDFDSYEIAGVELNIVHYTNDSFNETLIQKARENGWHIFKNAYVNSETTPLDDNYNQIEKIKTLGGKIIQTDHPVLVKNYLD